MAGKASTATRVAPVAAAASSFTGSADSYNRDDARHFLCQLRETRDFYSEATLHDGHLESCLEAT